MKSVVKNSLNKAGITSLKPVQKKVIPEIEAGKNLFVQSETGSGKTLSYLIPVLDMCEPMQDHPQALILVPTRELALQVSDTASQVSLLTRHHIVTVIGGLDIHKQENALRHHPDIVIGTPGRIMDLVNQNKLHLNELKICILDEADQIISTGQKEQTLSILHNVHVQTVCLSATMNDQVISFLPEPYEILQFDNNHLNKNITSYYIETEDKQSTLFSLLDTLPVSQAIIFSNYKKDSACLAELLQKRNILCNDFSSEYEEKKRIHILNDFKKGKLRILVATDAAARGLDITDVSHIIHYDVPADYETYIHRSGRTAHQGNTGITITLMSTEDKQTETGKWILEHSQIYTEKDIHPSDLTIPLQKDDADNHLSVIRIHAGRKDKIRPKDIIGSLCTIFPFKDIGVLEIQDTYTSVTMLKPVSSIPDHIHIKGKNRKLTIEKN
ncbi:MAG: DEAD/DEAH box helicase [Erysipelotrichaceae bacterium]|nr:DEAD/DEAH box helicase [Erysipelotrichaceae bacterium]